MNWLAFWMEQWPGFVVGVLSSLSAAAIGALLKRAYPALKRRALKAAASWLALSKGLHALSKAVTAFRKIDFVAAAGRRLGACAPVVAEVTCKLAFVCFVLFALRYHTNRFTRDSYPAQTATYAASGACYCPTSAGATYVGGSYTSDGIGAVRRAGSSTRDCAQHYGGRPQYSVLNSIGRAPALDCRPTRKAGKKKRTSRPCAAAPAPAVVRIDGTDYGF